MGLALGRRGMPVWGLLGAAAAAGVVAGVGLAWQRHLASEEQLEEMQQQLDQNAGPALPPPPAPSSAARADPMEPDPRSLAGLPMFPNSQPRRLLKPPPQTTKPLLAISWFETEASLDDVQQFYAHELSRLNVSVASLRPNGNLASVAWFERIFSDAGEELADRSVMHIVTAVQEPSRTLVFLAASQPQRVLDENPALPEGVLLPPGAQTHVFELDEIGSGRTQVLAEYIDRPLPELQTELGQTLKRAGWELSSVTSSSNAPRRSFSATRRGARLVGSLSARGLAVDVLLSLEGVSP